MLEPTLDEFLQDHHDAIVAAVQERLRGDPTMLRVAAQRGLGEGSLGSQVLGFWLQAMRTDLVLGSTAALAQNMGWLVNLRAGHQLPFDNAMVMRIFDDLSAEIDARLDTAALHSEYAAYRGRVIPLIAAAFPPEGSL